MHMQWTLAMWNMLGRVVPCVVPCGQFSLYLCRAGQGIQCCSFYEVLSNSLGVHNYYIYIYIYIYIYRIRPNILSGLHV